jgi:pyruvate dehydrogenase E1 component
MAEQAPERNGSEPTDDLDRQETEEWLESLDSVVAHAGPKRAHDLLERVIAHARVRGAAIERVGPTPYVNTIPTDEQPELPGDPGMERRIRSMIRWNAIAMVLRANAESSELGGHIASYQSAAVLYEIGFNHFWKGATDEDGGDLIYFQGHSSPGIYARAYLEGRLSEEQLLGFRQEVSRESGLSSYPHPWLMPGFWRFPTVSMGLGPIMAIHQAYFMRYLTDRGIKDAADRKVWCFLGDGETDEPETLGEIALAGREGLDNLVFVVNCNLQRLDGPVFGNGKIIQQLETVFRGAGWNVIKVIWGDRWDPLLAADEDGRLVRRMEEAVDGEYQAYKARDGAYVRENFFGADPELAKRVEDMSDEEIWALNRGGHDVRKVYAAYHAAQNHTGQPTVILAKTVKGYGMGVAAGEGQNITHQQKKMNEEALFAFRDRFDLEISDEDVRNVAFFRPDENSDEMKYLQARREELGGFIPDRRERVDEPLPVPGLEIFESQLEGSGEREISTTMVFVRLLAALLRDKQLGPRIVPIVPDESRTFGMEGMFRQLGIYSHVGQLYEPEDAGSMMFYKEDQKGQVLQEGINEAGAMSAWIAAATSYSNHDTQMLPFYIFYSMFGFQRVGDLCWAAGDSRARGFLLGGTAGRTTLNGEGLQHQDGHSHVLAATVPNCISYDPAYGYELAVIIQDGLRRMVAEQEDVFYYLTVMNENYRQPGIPEGAEEGILRGMHRVAEPSGEKPAVRLFGSGTILRESLAAAELLAEDFDVDAEVWSVTSYTELRREALLADREAMLGGEPDEPWVRRSLGTDPVPTVAASDYIKALPDGIRAWVPGHFEVLGTDGFGRSDWRKDLRRFFEVDRHQIAVAALHALAASGEGPRSAVKGAIEKYGIDADAPDPSTI